MDNFDSFSSSTWTRYSGVPSCCKTTMWSPSQVSASGGLLNIAISKVNGKWTTSGISNAKSSSQTYGKWSVRFRMDKGYGTGMDMALRPQGSGTVLNFAEESSQYGANQDTQTATLHYGSTMVHAKVHGDFSQWNTMNVTWTPGKIVVDLNGTPWATYTSHVPSTPMHLTIQANVGSNGYAGVNPNSSTPSTTNLQVDSITVSKYNG